VGPTATIERPSTPATFYVRPGLHGVTLPRHPDLKEAPMSEYVRNATFEYEDAALDALVNEINSSEAPPEGLPATGVSVLVDRDSKRAMVLTRFANEEDLRKGSEVLEGMSPPTGGMKRLYVGTFEVVVDRQMPE
jgi:hypothetical protein